MSLLETCYHLANAFGSISSLSVMFLTSKPKALMFMEFWSVRIVGAECNHVASWLSV